MEKELIKLCELNGVSGREAAVRQYIIDKISGHAEITVDPLGNIIAHVKGKNSAVKKVMVDAHMDEVGLIITAIKGDGTLKFTTVGGIDVSVLMARRVMINDNVCGVISSKPVHMLSGGEKDKMPDLDSLYIDIGVNDKESAEALVSLGDIAAFLPETDICGDLLVTKAIDDRAGCAVLMDLILGEPLYDFYATFSVLEEVGAGAKTAAFTVDPDFAVVLEATTAADIRGVASDKTVCNVGEGAVLSFMDRGTLYDKQFFDYALEVARDNNIKCQVKRAVAGGNNAAGIHQTRGGIKTLAISAPCRYIHSPSCAASVEDIKAVRDLARVIIENAAAGNIK